MIYIYSYIYIYIYIHIYIYCMYIYIISIAIVNPVPPNTGECVGRNHRIGTINHGDMFWRMGFVSPAFHGNPMEYFIESCLV